MKPLCGPCLVTPANTPLASPSTLSRRQVMAWGLASTAVVSTAYGADDLALATLGTVGPTRMDYPATIAAVGAVARYVGRTLASN